MSGLGDGGKPGGGAGGSKKAKEYVRDMQEVKSLESEIMGIEIAREEGFEKLNGIQEQVLNDAKEYLKTMQKSKDFTKASKKEWAELANTVKESLNFNASQESIQNRIVDLKKKEKTMGLNTQAAQGTAKKQLANKKTAKMFGGLTKALGGLTGKLGMLMKAGGPVLLLVSAIQFIIDLFLGFNKRIADVYEHFGQINIRMGEILAKSTEWNAAMLSIGKKFSDLVPVAANVGKQLAMYVTSSFDWAHSIVDTSKALAMSEDTLGKMYVTLAKARNFTVDMAEHFTKVTFATGLLSDQLAVPSAVIEDMANNSDLFYKMTQATNQELMMTAINAAKLNSNMDTFQKIGESILDVETLTTKTMQAQSLLGTEFNLTRAAMLYNEQDMLGFQKEILLQIRNMQPENVKTIKQQEMMSELLGIEWEQIVAINNKLMEGVDINNLNAGELEDIYNLTSDIQGVEAQDPMSKMLNILKSELIPILEEKLVPVFEWILWAFESMADFFGTISDWLSWLNPFNDSYYQDKAISEKQKERDNVWKYGTASEKAKLEEEILAEQKLIESGQIPDWLEDAQGSDQWRSGIKTVLTYGSGVGTASLVYDTYQALSQGNLNNTAIGDVFTPTSNSLNLLNESNLSSTWSQQQQAKVKEIFTRGDRSQMFLKDILNTPFMEGEGLTYSELRELQDLGIDLSDKSEGGLIRQLATGFTKGWEEVYKKQNNQQSTTIGKDRDIMLLDGNALTGVYN